MKTAAVVLLSILSFRAGAENAQKPRLSEQQVVFHTNVGDIAVAFYQDLAPKHMEQILNLVKAGVYAGVPIGRIDKGFVAQVYNYDARLGGLTPEQKALVKKIPAEFNSIPHRRGILSMAHYDEDINSAESSFSFVLGDAPHLDGKYTVFGEVVGGMDVLLALESIPVDKDFAPISPVLVERADVIEAGQLAEYHLQGPRLPDMPSERAKILFEWVAGLMFLFTISTPICKSVYPELKKLISHQRV